MNEVSRQLLLAGLLSIGVGLAGCLLPHPWNPLRPRRFLANLLSDRVNRALPKILGTLLAVSGLLLITASFVAPKMPLDLSPDEDAPPASTKRKIQPVTSSRTSTTVPADPQGIDALNEYGYTELMMAVDEGDLEQVRRLIAAGADVDVRGPNGATALHIAVNAGYDSVTRALVEAGADLNVAEEQDRLTPLMMAVIYSPSLVKPLLAAGADPEVRQWRGATALDLARDEGYPEDGEVIRLLTEAAEHREQR